MRAICVVACLAGCLLFDGPVVLGQEREPPAGKDDEGKKDEKDDGDDPEPEPEEEKPEAPPLSDREKRVLGLFHATDGRFDQGRVILTYDFGTRQDDLVTDWRPALETTAKRTRWSVTREGPFVSDATDTVTSSARRPGIMISDFGQWLHKAVFVGDVEAQFTVWSMSQPRAGTIVAPVFYHPKKKRALGAQCGQQAVILTGAKPVPAGSPHPKGEKSLPVTQLHTIGFRYNGKVFECTRDGKVIATTSEAPKLVEGFDAGHLGIAWNGAVKCFIGSATISGRLDPDWVAEALGEKGAKK